MKKPVRLALVHLEVHHKDPKTNRENLLRWNLQAVLQGADLILNTELPLTGYSFFAREDLAGYVESDTGVKVMKLMAFLVAAQSRGPPPANSPNRVLPQDQLLASFVSPQRRRRGCPTSSRVQVSRAQGFAQGRLTHYRNLHPLRLTQKHPIAEAPIIQHPVFTYQEVRKRD